MSIVLSASQAKAMEVIVTAIINYSLALERVKNYSDEQCDVLVDVALRHTRELDARREGH